MKKISILLLLLATFMYSCQSDERFILNGQIEGLPSDTLTVFYELPEYKLDTIVATQGIFEYAFTPDTTTIFSLILNGKDYLPIIAEKEGRVSLKGSITNLTWEADDENKLMSQYCALLKTKENDREALKNTIDSLIVAHPFSFTNLYLIRKYYLQENLFSSYHLYQTIDKLGGVIKDTPFISDLLHKRNNKTLGNYVSQIKIPQKDNNEIPRKEMSNKIILVNFWASWNQESCQKQDSLKTLVKKFNSKDFIIINVSLDLDRKAWLNACVEADSKQWKHVCDFTGWENSLVSNQRIYSLPANFLMNTRRDIVERNISYPLLENKIKQLLKEEEEAKAKAKKKRKK